jgi:hypothetical protein
MVGRLDDPHIEVRLYQESFAKMSALEFVVKAIVDTVPQPTAV